MNNSNNAAGHARLLPNAPHTFTSCSWLVALLSLFVLISTTFVQAAVISGTVVNKNTQRFLERALVEVSGTQLKALTAPDGSYRISGVPAGTHTVTADYSGLEIASQTVTVGENDTSTVAFELTADVYQLDTMVVTSSLEGNAYAINQQRRAESLRSVTSIDAFGDNVSGNPGEFLRNVSGIQMDFSQVEPNYIRVRGQDPNLTQVTMDGNFIASADSNSTERRTAIDQLSLGTLDNVEVFKAPIPSMSANAIGGAINFNTKSAFNQKGRRVGLTLGLTANSKEITFAKTMEAGHSDTFRQKIFPVGRFDYSNSFFDNRLGVTVSIGHSNVWVPADSESRNLVATALPGTTLPPLPTLFNDTNVLLRTNQVSFAPNRQHIQRDDISVNLDFKVTNEIEVYLKTSFTDYYSTNRQHSWTLNPTAVAPGFTTTDITVTNGTVSQGGNVFDKYTQSWNLNSGLRYRSGDWKVDAGLGFSKSINHYKNDDHFSNGASLTLRTVAQGASAAPGWTNSTPKHTDLPTSLVQTSGPNWYDLNNYVVSQTAMPADGIMQTGTGGFVSNNKRDSHDQFWSGKIDVQRDFRTRFPSYLKTGLARTEQTRVKRNVQERWLWVGKDGVVGGLDDLAPVEGMSIFAEPHPIQWNTSQQMPTFYSSKLIKDYQRANPQAFVFNDAFNKEQELANYRKVNEIITAAYLMSSVQINKLNVLGGFRTEQTTDELWGPQNRPSLVPAGVNANSLAGVLARRSIIRVPDITYRNNFKYLHLKYEWMPRLQTRLSYTEAIGRPTFTDLLPNTTITDAAGGTGSISVTNSGLKPQRSESFDFSVEYYPKSAGEWTFSWWHKDIKDYINTTSRILAADDPIMAFLGGGTSFVGYSVSTRTNLGSATFEGFEVGVVQKLSDFEFVPGFLRGFELWANMTRNTKMEGTFDASAAAIAAGTATKVTRLSNVAPKLINAGIRYRSPRGKFTGALTTNYQSEVNAANRPVPATGNQNAQVRQAYQFWNMDLGYRVSQRVLIKLSAKNLQAERKTNEQYDGYVINMENDSGTFWLLSTKIDL